jgi:molybdenum cofactor synthesis domain-containing protein
MAEIKTAKLQGEVSAAILIIGDEILSGRTKDTNTSTIAIFLGKRGIQVRETRTIPDVEATIVEAVNDFRARFDYVFTTGGIGPTHDDITADSMAKAFGVGIDYHREVLDLFAQHYSADQLTPARKRMARIPDGASLVDNPISKAPGFRLENVFVMAGIPIIVEAMLESLSSELTGGDKVHSVTVAGHVTEGQIAEPLGALETKFASVKAGSYPFYKGSKYGVSMVLRSTDLVELKAAAAEASGLVISCGGEPDVIWQE